MNSRATIGVLLAVLAGFALVLWRQQQTIDMLARQQADRPVQAGASPAPTPGAVPKALPALSTVDFSLPIRDLALQGDSKAAVVMVEFSDFECPFCGRYVRETLPRIKTDYMAGGRLRYGFRHYPLEGIHPDARNAATAALCAARQGKFWDLHDRLFANQTALEMKSLLMYGQGLGMDEARFGECLNGQQTSGLIDADKELARSLGFTGTPGFVIGRVGGDGMLRAVRRISGAQPYSVFQSAIEDVLAGK